MSRGLLRRGGSLALPDCLACIQSFSITRKSVALNEHHRKVVVYVTQQATKPMVKKACEAMFGFKVCSVRSINTKGALKITRRGIYKMSDTKRMILTIDGEFNISDMLGSE